MSNYTYQHDPRISGADFEGDDDEDYDREGDDCRNCGAILGAHGRCFYCEAAWVWVDGNDPRTPLSHYEGYEGPQGVDQGVLPF